MSQTARAIVSAVCTRRRRRAVKAAMRDSWGAYVLYAWGQDELLPASGQGNRAFCDTGTLCQLDMKGPHFVSMPRFTRHGSACLFDCPLRIGSAGVG